MMTTKTLRKDLTVRNKIRVSSPKNIISMLKIIIRNKKMRIEHG